MLYDAKNPIKTFNCYFIMRLSNFRVCFKQLIAGRCCNKSSNTVNDSVTVVSQRLTLQRLTHFPKFREILKKLNYTFRLNIM